MEVHHVRDSQSQERDTDSYQIDVELFKGAMRAKGYRTAKAQCKQTGLPRSTFHRVLRGDGDVKLRVAMRFSRAAGVSVNKLFDARSHLASSDG